MSMRCEHIADVTNVKPEKKRSVLHLGLHLGVHRGAHDLAQRGRPGIGENVL